MPRIIRHRLHGDDGNPFPYIASPNRGGRLAPRYLVMHYTAGSSADGAIRSLTNPVHKASAHIVIGRDGTATQLVPFDRVAWHAGQSRWLGLEGLNAHSIGIELDNAGVMRREGGRWTAWFGRTYPDQDVMVAVHKNETVERGWHRFPEVQIERALQIGGLLVERYGLEDVLGHDNIAPGRKRDPGPAFPLTAFRDALMGRAEDTAAGYATAANLNIREGPGIAFAKLPESPLAVGTRVVQRDRHGVWFQVDALDEAGVPAVSGWVHSHYLRPA